MKISLMQENLAKALSHISKAVSNRPNIPVLANVLLETEKGRLKLSATNLEIGINSWIGATVDKNGRLTVSARLLSDFVNTLKSGKLDLEEDGKSLVIKSVDNTAEFYIIPAEDFPQVPIMEGEAIVEVNALEFAEAIGKTVFAAGTDESRPVLTGVLLEGSGKQITMVAVDGFRLSHKQIQLKKELKVDLNEIVPAKALAEVERLIKDTAGEKDNVQIYLLEGKNQLLFKIADVELSTRLIEGKFPDYKQIMPKENALKLKIKREEFADMLKVVSIFARNVVGNKARFKVDTQSQSLSLTVNVIEVGNNQSVIKVKDIKGDDLETGFNVKFLSDMLGAMRSTDLMFESNGPAAPGVFLDPKDPDFVHVVMPMRLE